MSAKIEAQIVEVNDGPHYEVLLNSVPRNGDFINFFFLLRPVI